MSNKLTVSIIPCLRRSHLVKIAENAETWDFNRQLDLKAVKTLSRDKDILYPIEMSFPHEHRHGVRCEPHMRLMLGMPKGIAFADVPADFLNSLPKTVIVNKGRKTLLAVQLDENDVPFGVGFLSSLPEIRKAAGYLQNHYKNKNVGKYVFAQLETPAL